MGYYYFPPPISCHRLHSMHSTISTPITYPSNTAQLHFGVLWIQKTKQRTQRNGILQPSQVQFVDYHFSEYVSYILVCSLHAPNAILNCKLVRLKKRWTAELLGSACLVSITVCREHDSRPLHESAWGGEMGGPYKLPCYQRPAKCHAATVDELISSSHSPRERSDGESKIFFFLEKKTGTHQKHKDMTLQWHAK